MTVALTEYCGQEIDIEAHDADQMTIVGPLCRFVSERSAQRGAAAPAGVIQSHRAEYRLSGKSGHAPIPVRDERQCTSPKNARFITRSTRTACEARLTMRQLHD